VVLGARVVYVLGHTSCGAVSAAVRAQTLVEASTVIASLVKERKVIVAGGIFDLQSGRVDPVSLP
jgi:carbonic anhydrase